MQLNALVKLKIKQINVNNFGSFGKIKIILTEMHRCLNFVNILHLQRYNELSGIAAAFEYSSCERKF